MPAHRALAALALAAVVVHGIVIPVKRKGPSPTAMGGLSPVRPAGPSRASYLVDIELGSNNLTVQIVRGDGCGMKPH